MSQQHSAYTRRLPDDYPTSTWASQVVVAFVPPRVTSALDPAEGAGGTVQALNQAGLQTIGTPCDFLTMTRLPDPSINTIITNPPYGKSGRLAVKFIEHALKLVPIAAMLLKVDFDSGRTRTHLFRDCPAFGCKLTLLNRIEWFPGEYGSSTNHAWFIWDQQHSGPPTIAYAGKADAAVFDPVADVWGGTREAFAVIRERVHQGGPGWSAMKIIEPGAEARSRPWRSCPDRAARDRERARETDHRRRTAETAKSPRRCSTNPAVLRGFRIGSYLALFNRFLDARQVCLSKYRISGFARELPVSDFWETEQFRSWQTMSKRS